MTFYAASPRASPGLKITPRSSPFSRSPASRSPIKSKREESCLALRKVIGNTANSSNGIDFVADRNLVAYLAGATAVVAQVSSDGTVEPKGCFWAMPSIETQYIHPPLESANSPNVTPRARSSIGANGPAINSALSGFGRDFSSSVGSASTLSSSIREAQALPDSRLGASKDRIRTGQCIAISPDGRLVAFGETGHRPRIVISVIPTNDGDSPGVELSSGSSSPLAAISEHVHGVNCLAFSPDSQLLASLGDPNDGFLRLWRISQRSGTVAFLASNRCISNVRKMAWVGDFLVTVGLRHVKVWQVSRNSRPSTVKPFSRPSDIQTPPTSPSKALLGRNCLLGDLLDKVFISITPIPGVKHVAILCTEEGDICLLEDIDSNPRISKLMISDFPLLCATMHNDILVVSGKDGQFKTFPVNELLQASANNSIMVGSEIRQGSSDHVIGIGSVGTFMITLNTSYKIELWSIDLQEPDSKIVERDSFNSTLQIARHSHLPSHRTSIKGLCVLDPRRWFGASFLSYSLEGQIILWRQDGECLQELISSDMDKRLVDCLINDTTVVKPYDHGQLLFCGDQTGVLTVLSLKQKCIEKHANQDRARRSSSSRKISCDFEMSTRAHSSQITDIALARYNLGTDVQQLVFTAGRDRMLQMFIVKNDVLQLQQTMNEHVGPLLSVCCTYDGRVVASSSSDRTIIIRRMCEDSVQDPLYIMEKTIAVKATPLSMSFESSEGKEPQLLVTSSDKLVTRYRIRDEPSDKSQGSNASRTTPISSFKASDLEDGDAVALSSAVSIVDSGSRRVAGVSSTDKSVRVYDDNGRLLGRAHGHSEALTGVICLENHFDRRESENLVIEPESTKTLVTTATDGTIFLWEMAPESDSFRDKSDLSSPGLASSVTESRMMSRPPLRKVISSGDLAILKKRDEVTDIPVRSRSRSPQRRAPRLSVLPKPEFAPLQKSKSAADSSETDEGVETLQKSGIKRLEQQRDLPLLSSSSMKASSPTKPHKRYTMLPDIQESQALDKVQQNGRSKGATQVTEQGLTRRVTSKVPPANGRSTLGGTPSLRRRSSETDMGSRRHSMQPRNSSPNRENPSSSKYSVTTSHEKSLAGITQQLCHDLHMYRKKLSSSPEMLSVDNIKALERELSHTAKALSEKASRSEAVLERLLDTYSGRLVDLLDEKIASSIAREVQRYGSSGNEASSSNGASGTGELINDD